MIRRTRLLWLAAVPIAALLIAMWKLYDTPPQVVAPLAEPAEAYSLAPIELPVTEGPPAELPPDGEGVPPSRPSAEAMSGLRLRTGTPPQLESDAFLAVEPARVPNTDTRRALNELRRRARSLPKN